MNKTHKNNDTAAKYGLYSVGMTAIVIAIIVVLNLIASSLNISFDLTKNKLYTLSEQTYNVLDSIDKDVKIYALFEKGGDDLGITKILDKYSDSSSYVSFETVDPYLNPQMAKKYAPEGEELPIGTVIVESGDKYKVISKNDMAEYEFDPYTGSNIMKSLNIESSVTGAISYVVSGDKFIIYSLTGHDDDTVSQSLEKQLENENYEVRYLDIISSGGIPSDADVLLINGPSKDVTADEAKIIMNYIENEGRALFMLGATSAETPNLNAILEYYGLKLNNAMVIEGDINYVYQNNPYYLIPSMGEHDITNTLKNSNTKVFFPYPQGIEQLQTKRSSIKITPLLTTSDSSYAKKSITDLQAFEKAEGDIDGPFDIAVAIDDSVFTEKLETTKLVVLAGLSLNNDEINAIINGGNVNFIMNSLNWLQDRDVGISIRAKSINTENYLQINQMQSIIIMVSSVIVLPIIIFAIGIVTVIKRRNR